MKRQKALWFIVLALVLAVFVLLNLCARRAGERWQTAWDMTEEKLYALSDTTLSTVGALTGESSIYVFSAENEYPSMLREMLRRYGQLSDRLTITYADPAENPVLLSHYQQMGASVGASDMLVEGSQRMKAIPYSSLILYDEAGQPTGIDLEQQLTAALVYANSEYTPRVVFTTGHNERPTAALEKLFSDNNFTVETAALSVSGLSQPELMVIAAPAYDFTGEEIQVVQSYLQEGGRLMVFLEPSGEAGGRLQSFLSTLGITVQNNILFEERAYASGSPHNLIPMYSTHSINAYFAENPIYVVMPSACGLTLNSADARHKPEAVLLTTTDAYAKTNLQYTSSAKAADDVTGQFVVAATSGDNVFVAGSRMIYADDLMGMDTYANRLFLTRVINALWSRNVSVSISPKTLESAPLPINNQSAQSLGVLLTIVLPLAFIAVGLLVKGRRRSL